MKQRGFSCSWITRHSSVVQRHTSRRSEEHSSVRDTKWRYSDGLSRGHDGYSPSSVYLESSYQASISRHIETLQKKSMNLTHKSYGVIAYQDILEHMRSVQYRRIALESLPIMILVISPQDPQRLNQSMNSSIK